MENTTSKLDPKKIKSVIEKFRAAHAQSVANAPKQATRKADPEKMKAMIEKIKKMRENSITE